MIVYPEAIKPAAEKAGIKVPEDTDNYDKNTFPHFAVFCNLQLCRPMSSWSQHWENAKIIANIPEDRIRTITIDEIESLGFCLN